MLGGLTADQVAALPRLDIPRYTHQPPSGGDEPKDSAEQDEQPEAESKGPDEAST